MVETGVAIISWTVFAFETIAILALSGLRFFFQFKDNERATKGWFVELAIALTIPAWLSHFATAQGISTSFFDVYYSHFKLWLVIAPIQSLSLIFLSNAPKGEKPVSTIFYVMATSFAWAYCSWRGTRLGAEDNASAWGYMVFGIVLMILPIIQFVSDLARNIKNGIDNGWSKKFLILLCISMISWVSYWIDWTIGYQGWNWSWYQGTPEVLCQAIIDVIATLVFGGVLVLLPPGPAAFAAGESEEF